MGLNLAPGAKGFFRHRPAYVAAILYSVNTWGAVFGCFVAGYVLLAFLGETGTLLAAASGNVVAAAWAFMRVRKPLAAETRTPASAQTRHSAPDWIARLALAVAFANGLAALALEVLWSRVLSVYTDASIYSITVVIGTVLIGIALGSRLAQKPAERSQHPLLVLGGLSLAMSLSVGIALKAFELTTPITALGGKWFHNLQDAVWMPLWMFRLAAVAILPVTLISGGCFPFLVRLVVRHPENHGREMGNVYAINTIGGILGAILAGFELLPHLGDKSSFLLIASGYAIMGGLCIFLSRRPALGTTSLAVVLVFLFLLLPPDQSIIYNSLLKAYPPGSIAGHRDTAEGSVTAIRMGGTKRLLVNGCDMTLICSDTKLQAHIPLAIHPNPQSILIICFGMGSAFRSATFHEVKVQAVELQPAVLDFYPTFYPDAAETLKDSARVQRTVADGRNYLLLSNQKFSVITVDPSPPLYSAGTVNLYTKEFYQICRSHLDADGIMCMWVPFEGLKEDFRMILRTFEKSFPHAEAWQGPDRFGVIMLGSEKPILPRPSRTRSVLASPKIIRDLDETNPGFASKLDLASLRVNDQRALRSFIGEGPVLTDDRPYTEFPWFRWMRQGANPQSKW